MILVLLYALTIPAANWLIGHVGTTCVPDGPCLIPVLPGLVAPSGVLMIGAALLLRDLVQRRYGPAVSLAAIAAGVVISFVVAPPALALASAAAFAISELSDFAVYTPLVRRGFARSTLYPTSGAKENRRRVSRPRNKPDAHGDHRPLPSRPQRPSLAPSRPPRRRPRARGTTGRGGTREGRVVYHRNLHLKAS